MPDRTHPVHLPLVSWAHSHEAYASGFPHTSCCLEWSNGLPMCEARLATHVTSRRQASPALLPPQGCWRPLSIPPITAAPHDDKMEQSLGPLLVPTWISVGSVMSIPFRASTRGPFSPSCGKPSTRGAAGSVLGVLLRDTLTIVIWGARSGREEKGARWRKGRRTRAGREQAGAEKTAGRSEPPCAHVRMLAVIDSIVRRPKKRSGCNSLLAARTACIAGG